MEKTNKLGTYQSRERSHSTHGGTTQWYARRRRLNKVDRCCITRVCFLSNYVIKIRIYSQGTKVSGTVFSAWKPDN